MNQIINFEAIRKIRVLLEKIQMYIKRIFHISPLGLKNLNEKTVLVRLP